MAVRSPEKPSAHAQPMFYAALAFASGIVLAHAAWRPPLWWLLAVVSLALCATVLIRRRALAAFVIALGVLVALGALARDWERNAEPRLPELSRFTRDEATVTGHVIRASFVRERERDQMQTVDLQTESIDGEAVSVGLRVSLFAEELDTPLVFGERLRLRARLREPRNYGNPGAMDFRGYLQERGIQLLASVKAEKIDRLPGKSGTRLESWRSAVRRSLIEKLLALATDEASWRKLSREDVALLAAMLIGEQSLIRRDTKREFQRTGAFHILVVSGMNVGILAVVVFAMAKWLRAGEYVATAATITLSLFYAYMTDLGAPIMRAAVMLALYLAARLLYRGRHSLNAVGTAALLLLVAAPRSLFDPSFQLTFLSVTALGGITQPLVERTSEPLRKALYGLEIFGYDAALPPRLAQFRLDLRLIAGRLERICGVNAQLCGRVLAMGLKGSLAVFDLAVITLVLQLALALTMVYYFHRVALLGLPTNMVVIPIAALLMPIGIVATLLSHLSPVAASVVSPLAAVVLHAITGTVAFLGGTRFAELRTATPTTSAMLFAAAAFLAALLCMGKRRRVATGGILLLVMSAGWLALPPEPRFRTGVVEITVIDVGQGDSILVVSPEGKTLLVDGGGPLGFVRSDAFEIGEDVVSPYLWSRGITRLDAVALTHPHTDHMGGLRSIIANFAPQELWVGVPGESDDYNHLIDSAQASRTKVIARRAGEQIEFGTMEIRVLAPAARRVAESRPNDESLVLEVHYRDSAALLTGDAESRSEREIAQVACDVDLLKVAHHGSATSTTPALLATAKPEFAAISVGARNVYGHPKADVMERLAAAHVRTFRTDMHGAITFYLDGKRVRAETFAGSR